MKKEMTTRKFISMLAFIAILFAMVALIISRIFTKDGSVFAQVANILRQLSYALAFIVAGIYAYPYVRSKHVAWFIVYIIACVVVAVFIVLPMFGI